MRPALVVSSGGIEDAHGLLWVVMITSAENRGWPGDVPVRNLAAAGLPVPSVIRTAKLTTILASDATKLGRVPAALFRKVAIDSERGQKLYAARMATVEPVFANLRHNKRLDRFTLRTRPKVNTQRTLYCLVHNIEKLAHHGYWG